MSSGTWLSGQGRSDAGRILVDAIEDAGIVQVAISRRETPTDLISSQCREHGQKRLPMGRTRPWRSTISSNMPGSGR